MKLLNKILKKFGLIIIPIKPTRNDLSDICFKWDHSFGFSRGMRDDEIIAYRKTHPLEHLLTLKEKNSMMDRAEDAYRCIIENPRLYK